MTNANVMALNVQAVTPKAVAKSDLKSVTDGSSKGIFDEAMGRLQQEAQKEMASAGRDDTPQNKDAGDGGSGREGAPHNPLTMIMGLPLQPQAPVEDMPAEAPAAVLEFTEDAHISVDTIKTSSAIVAEDVVMQQNLRTLLPQSDEAMVKNKDFLAMLSGDLTSGQKAEVQGRQKGAAQLPQGVKIPEGMEVQNYVVRMEERPSQAVEARLVNPWQMGQTLSESEPRDPLGLALKQAQKNLPQAEPATGTRGAAVTAQAVQQVAMVAAAQENAAVAVSVVEPASKAENLQALVGNKVVVEIEPEAQPLRDMHGQASQENASFGHQQEKQAATPQGGFAAVVETEEPAVPVQGGATNPGAGASQINIFQPQAEAAPSVEATEAPVQAQTDYEVPGQIVQQARLIRSGQDTEMVIHLKPEHLGDLTLKISVTENGAVTASFHSDNAQVRTIIENSLVQLRQELNDQGLKVDSVEVFSGLPDGHLPQGQGQQAWQQGSRGRFMGDRKPEDYAEEADELSTAALSQSQEGMTDDGVDYRV